MYLKPINIILLFLTILLTISIIIGFYLPYKIFVFQTSNNISCLEKNNDITLNIGFLGYCIKNDQLNYTECFNHEERLSKLFPKKFLVCGYIKLVDEQFANQRLEFIEKIYFEINKKIDRINNNLYEYWFKYTIVFCVIFILNICLTIFLIMFVIIDFSNASMFLSFINTLIQAGVIGGLYYASILLKKTMISDEIVLNLANAIYIFSIICGIFVISFILTLICKKKMKNKNDKINL